MRLSDEVLEYAETPDRFALVADGGSISRFDDGRVCIMQGATWASVTAVDIGPDEVEALVAQVHDLVEPGKHCTWWLGPSVRPADLPQRLLEHGLTVSDVPLVKSLALVDPPPPISAGIEVRRITTFEDYVAAREVVWEAFETPEDRRDAQREHLRADFDESTKLEILVSFMATLDGRPAATGLAVPSERGVFLFSGSTSPWARGRGLYRALVRARWDYAVERGTPALVTQAVPDTSYPILTQLGFQDVCVIVRRDDRR